MSLSRWLLGSVLVMPTVAWGQGSPPVTAPPEDAQNAQPADDIVVTGTSVRRRAAESFNPVQVIGAEEIATSGRTTTADLLRSISANTGNAANETSNTGWASGAAGIGLRGLSQKNTLVLLNGRRVANYGFPANGLSDTFVNLNALPLVAVQRIEVLKDGASAAYGSDAVAGVVNIITRQAFRGLEGGASYGTSDAGGLDSWRGYVVAGHGDLDRDGYNIQVSAEAYLRERLDQDQRALTRTGIYDSLPGGRWNGWTAKGARFLVNGTSIPLLDAQGRCPSGMQLVASGPIDGLRGDTCAINLAPYTTLIPSTDRYQGFARGTVRLGDRTEAFAEMLYSYTKGTSIFGSSPYFTLEGGRFALNAQTGLAEPVSNLLPANNPYNPFGRPTQLEYTFFDLGQSLKTNRSDAFRGLVGIRGTVATLEWEATAYASGSTERERVAAGFANRWTLAQALADGSLNLYDPASTPQAVLDGIRLSTLRPARSRLYAADAKISGKLVDLPAGPLQAAIGAEIRKETLVSRNPREIDLGLQIRPAIAAVDGSRRVIAGHVELAAPVVRGLDIELAARSDWYDDFGHAFSPKAGFRWRPFAPLMIRGSASRGFRAPSLSENSASTNISYAAVIDPYDPDVPNSRQNPTSFIIGNTKLAPERTHSLNLGAVLTPSRGSTISIDFYRLRLSNLIGTADPLSIVRRNDPAEVVRDVRGKLVVLYNRFQNLSSLRTSGIDVEIAQRIDAGRLGQLQFSSAYTHVIDYRRPNAAGGPLLDFAGSNLGPTLPSDKATTRLAWQRGPADWTLTWYHTSGYRQVTAAAVQDRVNAYDQIDAYVGWSLAKGTKLFAKISNLFDQAPPYDAAFPGIRAPYDFTQYDLRGRFFELGATFTF